MRIRTKILLSHGVMTVAVALICLVIVAGQMVGQRNQRHLQASYEQIRNINLIAARANDYSEQVAELFILGAGDIDQIMESRAELHAALDREEELVREELEQARGTEIGAAEEAELEHVAEMRALVDELDLVRVEIGRLLLAERRAEAETLYDDQVEHRLDRALGALIEVVTVNERAQVEAAIATSARLARQTTALTSAVAAIVVLIGVANAVLLERMISRPIAALAAGADAVARGDLTHVVGHPSRDELGNLAARFDLMTGQIREQHDRLEHARATLAEQVEERTQQLRERSEALESAVDRLRELDASRARFLADISHELRTPLTILRGQTEVALRNPGFDADDLRRTLRLVVHKADQMGRLVEDLLFLARSEAGSIEVRLDAVVLQEVIADVLLDSQALSRRAHVTISPRQPAEPVRVLADADRLRQAVLIALDNAVKFAPAGTIVVLELRAGAGHAAIRVTDQGPGLTPEQMEGAFTRFYRGRAGNGTGLGLAIAKWIVDQHSGTITIASEPDRGATLEIAVPLLNGAA